jgi:hypothetical protein
MERRICLARSIGRGSMNMNILRRIADIRIPILVRVRGQERPRHIHTPTSMVAG